MSLQREMISGRFYWAMPALDCDSEENLVNKRQPARYLGDDKLQWIGCENDDWPACWVGDEISQSM